LCFVRQPRKPTPARRLLRILPAPDSKVEIVDGTVIPAERRARHTASLVRLGTVQPQLDGLRVVFDGFGVLARGLIAIAPRVVHFSAFELAADRRFLVVQCTGRLVDGRAVIAARRVRLAVAGLHLDRLFEVGGRLV
jgi:hypothetical protein